MNARAEGQVEVDDGAEPTRHNPARFCIAYLVNQYPKISHAFIRREITALEHCGVRVERFSLRLSPDRFVDEADRSELKKTRIVLQSGPLRLAMACAAAMLTRPVRFA